MEASVDIVILREGLNKVLSVVDKKNTRPILTFALINILNDSIQLIATDLEVSTKIIIPSYSQSTGTFCVNAKNLFDILKELPNGQINLKVADSENVLNLNFEDIHYKLLIYKNDEFPSLSFSDASSQFKIDSKQILEVINKTSYAISNDETRLFLNGIFLQEVDSKLRAVATDGHRLSVYDLNSSQASINSLINGVIIPKKGIFEIKKMAENFIESVLTFSLDDSFIYISINETYFLSIRLIARDYPKYQAVIPNKTSFILKTNRDLFLNAIKRIRIMSNEKTNGIRLLLNNSELIISANHPSLGDAKEKIAINYTGDHLEIGFNAKYLIDTLSSFDEGEIQFEVNNELSPIILKSENLPNYLGVIMPLKL